MTFKQQLSNHDEQAYMERVKEIIDENYCEQCKKFSFRSDMSCRSCGKEF
jgi:hypothetical protein